MNRFRSRLTLHLSTFVLLGLLSQAAQAVEPSGPWQGAIELPGGGRLEITVALTPGAGQVWTGTIDIPAQSLRGFALSAVSVEGRRVHFEMGGIPGQPTFDGELAESGDSISGTIRQGPQTLRFSLRRPDAAAAAPDSSAAPAPPARPLPGDGPVGEWLGTLDVGPLKLRLALHVEKRADGGLAGSLDSLDQGAKVPVDAVVFESGTLKVSLPAIGASFEGKMNADGSAFEGRWSQGGRELPLTFQRQAEAVSLKRPQHPQGPFPYAASEVAFPSQAGGVRLAGTLLLPEGKGPFPAVALVTGSGPQDRDETLMGHKPFLVIADALARRGIASLRWDDRGFGQSAGNHMGSTVDDFAADVRAAAAFLRSRPEVDGRAIGILGHSEGGLTAPMVAAADRSVRFLVLLAPPGEPLRSLLLRQTGDLYRLQGIDPSLIERALAAQAEDLDLIMDSSLTVDQLQAKLRSRAEGRTQFTAEERARLQRDGDAIEQTIQVATTAWFRSLVRQDPAKYLRGVKVPVLALFGEKDLQVAAQVNAQAVRAALAAARNPDYEVRTLPGLNHLFQHAETGGIDEYSRIEETFAPEVLSAIADWIAARSPKGEAQPAGGGLN